MLNAYITKTKNIFQKYIPKEQIAGMGKRISISLHNNVPFISLPPISLWPAAGSDPDHLLHCMQEALM